MGAKLLIDLAKCKLSDEAAIRCSYKHHPANKGFDSLVEMIRFALICRRCETAPCIKACPRNALEKQPSDRNDAGALTRHNMLCTGCGTCAIACPFGTIYTDLIPFASSVCDLCRGRLATDEQPLCVRTDQCGALQYTEIDPAGADDLVEVFDDIVVRVGDAITWQPLLTHEEKAKQ